MNLKVHLVLRIIFVASVCFGAVTVYVVLHSHRDVMGRAEVTAERMAKQLALQLVRISTGTDLPARFPDWYVFEPQHLYGMCARFVAVDGATLRSVCEGTDLSSRPWPAWFEIAYRRFFVPAKETERPVTLHTQVRGVVVVTPTAEREIGEAWRAVRELLGLTAVTVFALCLMTYASLARVLRPAAQIVADLERMHQGDLAHRLPRFELVEFQKISAMVNRLAGSLDRSMAARAELNRKLLSAHEEERRWLTRELHDEIGQCLAGINALSASISYTAERECPRLVQEAEQIGHIVEHMMGLVQNLLARLRPPELDELGLCECLRRLVQGWNDRSAGRTIFELDIRGALETVPPALTGHLYRIVQESLSNASKHAAATRVCTRLEITPREPSSLSRSERVEVIVEDNGVAKAPLADGDFGLGLSGMKERVTALGGDLTLETRAPSGLIVRVLLPLDTLAAKS